MISIEETNRCEHRNVTRLFQYLNRVIHCGFGALNGRKSQKKTRILQTMFLQVNDFLQTHDFDYWIDFGTLLGFYRESNILSHDIDVDFGLHEKDYTRMLTCLPQLPKGFQWFDKSECHNGPKLKVNYKGFDVDFYFYEDRGETVRSYENTKWPNERRNIPKSLIYPLGQVDFLGASSKVPAQPKEYLEFIYGYLGTDSKRNQETGFWEKVEA